MEKPEDTQKKSGIRDAFRRVVRGIANTTLTLGVITGAAFAVQYGASELARRAEAAPMPDAAPAIAVSANPLQLQDGYDVRRSFIGQVEAQKSVSVSFELAGRLEAILVDEGDMVREGQVLARLDISLLQAERSQLLASKSAAEAQLKFANQTVVRSEELRTRGFAPQASVDEALARRNELTSRIAEIDARIANVDIRIAKSEVIAPFDGRVTSRNVDGGEALNPGHSIVGLMELAAPQVRVGLPLDLDETKLTGAEITIEGAVLPATLVSFRPDIDPVTRTRTAIFAVDAEMFPAFGQTARLLVTERIQDNGFWIPLTSLKEGVRGQWTLLTVDADAVVRAAPVEVLHAESERVFVRAAFADGTPLIDKGPQRVTVGQQVVLNFNE